MNAARVELIHELVSRAIADGLANYEIKNRISSFTHGTDERQEGLRYLTLIRTRRGEELNIFTGESNVSDMFRSSDRLSTTGRIDTLASAETGAPRTSKVSRGFTARQIRQTVAAVWRDTGEKPTRAAVSSRLNTSESTLRRAMDDLRMGPWPPAMGED